MRLPLDPRDLDRRVLPDAARRLRAGLDAAHLLRLRGQSVVTAAGRRVAGQVGEWGRRTDERYARGPLALVRDVPQLAVLLVAAVFVSASFAAVYLAEPAPAGPADGPRFRTASLGVPGGADVDEHLAAAGDALERLADSRPDRRYLALVSLTDHLAVADLAALADGVAVQRVYLSAPGLADGEVVEVPLAGVASAQVLPALCTATAARKAADAESLRELAGTIAPVSTDEETQRAELLAEADRSANEAAAFDGDCRTVFALVVEGEAVALEALRDREGVRGVEAAPEGVSVLDLDVDPLLPSTTGTVPTGTER